MSTKTSPRTQTEKDNQIIAKVYKDYLHHLKIAHPKVYDREKAFIDNWLRTY